MGKRKNPKNTDNAPNPDAAGGLPSGEAQAPCNSQASGNVQDRPDAAASTETVTLDLGRPRRVRPPRKVASEAVLETQVRDAEAAPPVGVFPVRPDPGPERAPVTALEGPGRGLVPEDAAPPATVLERPDGPTVSEGGELPPPGGGAPVSPIWPAAPLGRLTTFRGHEATRLPAAGAEADIYVLTTPEENCYNL